MASGRLAALCAMWRRWGWGGGGGSRRNSLKELSRLSNVEVWRSSLKELPHALQFQRSFGIKPFLERAFESDPSSNPFLNAK